MQRALFFAACVAIFHVAISSDDDKPPKPPYTKEPPTITKETECGCGRHPPKCGKNEVYDHCKVNNCRPKECCELGYQLNCKKKCKPGCTCKDGYVKNDKGICIPIYDCPSCGGDKNATSGCGNNCGKVCGDSGKPVACSQACIVNGCDCRHGYYYDRKQKKCVRKEDCTPICEENEEYSPCSNGGCGPKKCSQINDPYICIDPICIKGCVCKKGYLRDAKNRCIPKEHCPKLPPKCRNKNEVYDDCKSKNCRPKYCSELGYKLDCNKKCKPGCTCKNGYVRNDKGMCIPVKDCPSCGGDKHAVSGCGNNCGKTCATVGKHVVCTLMCKLNACDCRDGYVYDPNPKKCVKKEDCTKPCKKNEVYSTCANGGCGRKNCSELNDPIKCIDPVKCKGGCVCKKGWLRDKNGICVLEKQCPPICKGQYEYYEQCIHNCRSQNCSDKGKVYHCHKQKPGHCDSSGCRCKPGYLRNYHGVCVAEKDCPKPCKKNEVYSPCINGGCNRKKCSELNQPIKCIHPKKCIEGCVCKKGWLRDKNGICVPEKQCYPICKGQNEYYEPCIHNCGSQNCSDKDKVYHCPKQKPGHCDSSGCRCKPGYLRNYHGVCVAEKDCPKPCKKNEVYSPCINGGCDRKKCSELNQPIKCIHPKKCIKGCVCKKGWLRDKNGICVPEKQCPPICKGKNEYYELCIHNCRSQNCSDKGKVSHCPKQKPGHCDSSGCRCKPGYLRNYHGVCVAEKDCPKPCKKNEVYSTCINGGCDHKKCSELNQPIKCIRPIKCIEGCVCKKGWLRDKNGICVPKKQCPQICKGQYEYYEQCIHNCRSQNCSDKGKVYHCHKQKPGHCDSSGCRCKPGYLRNYHGVCVAEKDCPKPCKKNEVYSPCINGGCNRKKCSELNQPIKCIHPKKCIEGCVCKKGWLRDKNGICVPEKQCYPICKGQNEYYEPCIHNCGSQNCSDKDKVYHCPKQKPGHCDSSGCRCKPGYLRNYHGVCIAEKDCPKPCKKNEVNSPCINGGCDRKKCSELNQPIKCIHPKKCIKGCVCKKGWLRDKNGICVPEKQCPPICKGKNEYYELCIHNCRSQNCSDKGKVSHCPKQKPGHCDSSGCRCKPGYLRNYHGVCVAEKDCPKPCKKNEVYSTCINGGCDHKKCSELNQPIKCIRPIKCIEGCVCKKGWLRDKNGICVPKKQCPPICKGQYEYYEQCIHNCRSQNCSDKGKLYHCHKQKPGHCDSSGCRCKPGYLRNYHGVCVAEKDCPKPCKKNEVYSPCINGGCNRKKCSELNQPIKCIHPKKCIEGCVCKKGWLRDKNGICVPEKQCYPICKGHNEYYEPCIHNCGSQNCSDKDKVYHCPKQKPGHCDSSGCRCKPGYLRNYHGVCIAEKDCPKPCKKNEVNSPCINGGCDRKKCSELNQPIKCIHPKKCIKGCVCKKGWLRDKNGICVPEKQCPPICKGKNEYYELCIHNCRSQNCSDKGKVSHCPKQKPGHCDSSGCRCKPGYLRNYHGVCVAEKDCPKPCKKNEVYSTCINGGCDHKKCSELNQPIKCIRPIKCIEGCVCKKGWLRDKNGICVPKKQCPPICKGQYEYYEQCIHNCRSQNCSDKGKLYHCHKQKPGHCDSSGCRCKPGYLRNYHGVCVAEKDCPKPCKKNEVYSPCINGGCDRKKCSELNQPIKCIHPKKCIEGCVCKKGWLRDKNGICVPEKQCYPICKGKNEYYEPCIHNCGSQNCSDKGKVYHCPNQKPGHCDSSGCRCKPGYLRNYHGVCVAEKDCPKPCKKNEVYSTCANCRCDRRYCSELYQPIKCIHPIKCKEGCVCKKGWLRNKNGICVPEKQCPQFCKGQHEYYEPCIYNCRSQNCTDIGKVYDCPKQKPGHCDSSGCRCKPGYLRDHKGVCVAQKDCPPLHCPPGEKWDSCPTVPCDGDYCPKTRTSPQTCPVGIVCDTPRCMCEYNRKRDWKTKRCIKIIDCPPFQCDCNEEYVACSSDCPGEKCSDYLNKTKCPPYKIGIIANCRPACKCKKGYYRNAKNECVLACDC